MKLFHGQLSAVKTLVLQALGAGSFANGAVVIMEWAIAQANLQLPELPAGSASALPDTNLRIQGC